MRAGLARLAETRAAGPGPVAHPFGDGRTGPRVAALLAAIDLETVPLTKRNTA